MALEQETCRSHRHVHFQQKDQSISIQLAGETAVVAHRRGAARDRRGLGPEIGEAKGNKSLSGVQAIAHVFEQAFHGGIIQLLPAMLAPMFQRLHKAAHVRAFEGGGQVHAHVHRSHGMLAAPVAVAHHQGQAEGSNAHPIDIHRQVGRSALHVLKGTLVRQGKRGSCRALRGDGDDRGRLRHAE